MQNPLEHLPLNTKLVYTMAKTHSGCEVYIPVDSFNDLVINRKKLELQEYFDSQPKANF